MVKTPNFDDRQVFGVISPGDSPFQPQDITVTPGMAVYLRYEGKVVSIDVTEVLEEQAEFQGVVRHFEDNTLEHEGLKQGDVVQFPYDKIEHIITD